MEEGYTSLRLIAAGQSHPGQRRPLNEDSWRIAQAAETGTMWPDRGRLFAVADGMGGHAAGEVASQVAIETLFAVYYDREREEALPPTMRLQEAIEAANHEVYGQSVTHDTQAGMGTTIVAAVVRDDWLTVANVGDSRAYLLRAGQAVQISQDHSWVAEQVAAGVLSHQEAETHIYRNVVTRCLGHRPTIQVDLFEHALHIGDAVLLCSDGLSNQVSGAEMVCALAENPPYKVADQMIALANERGGPDNITVVLFKMFDPADEAAARLAEPRDDAGAHRPRQTRALPLSSVLAAQPSVPRAAARKGKRRLNIALVVLLVAFVAVACGALLLVASTRIEEIRNLLLPPSPTTLPALITATPQGTETVTPQVTETVTPQVTETTTPQMTETATPVATHTPSATATETATTALTAMPTLTPTYTATPLPTDTLTPTPTPTVTPTRTPFSTSGPQPTQG